jgi:hypothetical protein
MIGGQIGIFEMVVERDEADVPPEVGDPIAAALGPLIEAARGAVATGRAGRSAGCQSRAHGARLGAPERAAGPHPSAVVEKPAVQAKEARVA